MMERQEGASCVIGCVWGWSHVTKQQAGVGVDGDECGVGGGWEGLKGDAVGWGCVRGVGVLSQLCL
jgi:hypothetical protein